MNTWDAVGTGTVSALLHDTILGPSNSVVTVLEAGVALNFLKLSLHSLRLGLGM